MEEGYWQEKERESYLEEEAVKLLEEGEKVLLELEERRKIIGGGREKAIREKRKW